jgi:hypothetical protein
MSELPSPPPIPPPPSLPKSPATPTFFKALRGIWLFTWKSQLTWQRLPGLALSLLALPVLIYITTFSPESWARHFDWKASPAVRWDALAKRFASANLPLQPDQKNELVRIFGEEYTRAGQDWRAQRATDSRTNAQAIHLQAAHQRIRDRARTLLDERQYAIFEPVEKQSLVNNLNRVRPPLWGRLDPFYRWLIDFYFFMVLPLWCVRASGALIRDELQTDTLGFLTTRPLSRAKLVIIKYLTQTAWLQIILLIQALLVFSAAGLRQVSALGILIPLFLAVQFLAVLAWCALGTCLGLVTKRYMPLAILYGLIVEMGIGRIPTNINTLSLMRHLKSLLGHNPALQGVYDWSNLAVVLPVGALLLATGLFLTLAALQFTFREYHHTAEIQS